MSGIQFAQILVDRNGNSVNEYGAITVAQIRDLAKSSDIETLQSALSELATRVGTKRSLGQACVMALDAFFQSDANEMLKAKIRRGRLIDEIETAEKDVKPLALEVGDIELLKERIGKFFLAASFVRLICLLLDPATKE